MGHLMERSGFAGAREVVANHFVSKLKKTGTAGFFTYCADRALLLLAMRFRFQIGQQNVQGIR